MERAGLEKLWQDRGVRFFLGCKLMQPRTGEFVIAHFQNIEDSRGNSGQMGELMITNLRIIWHLSTVPKVNVSIGHSCLEHMTRRERSSKLSGFTETVAILAKSVARYQFTFTKFDSSGLFQAINDVYKAYLSTRPYRDLKFNCPLSDDGKVQLLPQEELLETIDGVWNLSNQQGNLGTFFITNVRVVWISNTNKTYNGSIPHIQIRKVNLKDTKYGCALVITALRRIDCYVMGFQLHPEERMLQTAEDILQISKACRSMPNFGVRCEKAEVERDSSMSTIILDQSEDTEIDSSIGEDTCSTYLAEGGVQHLSTAPVFSKKLGLAIEPLKPGYTVENLWKVL